MLKFNRLTIAFGKPKSEDEVAYYAECAGAIEEFEHDASIWEDAMSLLVRTGKYHRFPLPSECRTACLNVLAQRSEAARLKGAAATARKPDPAVEWSKEAIALADTLIRCPLGSQAANEGWVLGLHSFCRKHRRLPNDHEIGALRLSAQSLDETYAALACANHPAKSALMKLGASLLARRDRCGRVTDGEVLP